MSESLLEARARELITGRTVDHAAWQGEAAGLLMEALMAIKALEKEKHDLAVSLSGALGEISHLRQVARGDDIGSRLARHLAPRPAEGQDVSRETRGSPGEASVLHQGGRPLFDVTPNELGEKIAELLYVLRAYRKHRAGGPESSLDALADRVLAAWEVPTGPKESDE